MKTFKKIVFLLTALALLIGCVPLGFAENDTYKNKYGVWTYTLNDEGVTITGFSGTATEVAIPETVNKRIVTTIATDAFSGSGITKLTIPKYIESMGVNNNFVGSDPNYIISALNGMNELETLIFSDGIKTIPYAAAKGIISLSKVVVPASVNAIGNYAFYGCTSLRYIVRTENSKTIDGMSELATIGAHAFENCKLLEKIGPLDELITIEGYAFCNSGISSIRLGENVESIGNYAFSGTNLQKIVLPHNLKTLRGWVFAGTNIKEIVIPKSVGTMIDGSFFGTSMSTSALNGMDRLKTVIFEGGEERTIIPACAVRDNAAVTKVAIPEGVTGFGDSYVFVGCSNLKTVVFPTAMKGSPKTEELVETIKNMTGNSITVEYDDQYFQVNYITQDEINYDIIDEEIPDPGEQEPDPAENIYNLGEETYGFENYLDTDSVGHCFGMAATSQGYYLDSIEALEMPDGLGSLYELKSEYDNESIKEEICRYQKIQGKYVNDAVIAGGHFINDFDRTGAMDEWNSVLGAVRDKKYDGSGKLMVGIWSEKDGGHMVSFLYYKEVKGEERIYVYDSNYPDTETYLYAADGKIRQAPYTGFGTPIDCIQLIDVQKYF
ncbi:MAG: leucine-rich repeat domain-containing protein, partial [Clostridia bacterium]|nr:leucine-rich repeat domain-containing protein [Clostridia bacterium]